MSAAIAILISFGVCALAHATPLVGYSPNGDDPYGVPAGLASGTYYERIFVTSNTYHVSTSANPTPGDNSFGSVAAADWQVTYAAYLSGLISSNWNGEDVLVHAILSDDTTSAAQHIDPYIQGPIFNTNNQLVAASANALWSGTLANPVGYDETGLLVGKGETAWTGTQANGTGTGLDAGNWSNPNLPLSATFGAATQSGPNWTNAGTTNAFAVLPLYGITEAFLVVPEPGSAVLAGVGLFFLFLAVRRRGSGPGSAVAQRLIALAALVISISPGAAPAAPLVGYSPNGDDPYGVPAGLASGTYYERIFVTSNTYNVSESPNPFPNDYSFGSVAAADFQVTDAAYLRGMISLAWNGEDVLVHAILSDDTTNAAQHIDPYIQGPIFNTNNQLVASGANALWSGTLTNPVGYDEDGLSVSSGTRVWSGTQANGTGTGLDAGNWSNPNLPLSATFGAAAQSGPTWVDAGTTNAFAVLPLYGITEAYLVVPEPSTWGLAICGLAGLVALGVKRRQGAVSE